MDEEGEAGVAGRSWWLTWACPGRRMHATRRQSPAGSPRRHGAAGRRAWTRARAQVGGRRSRGLGRLRPAGQKRDCGLLAPPFPFFRISFSQIFSKHILTHLKSFLGLAPKTKLTKINGSTTLF